MLTFCLMTPLASANEDIQKLRVLVENVDYSPTLRLWHKNKEILETEGYKIWLANLGNLDFCLGLDLLPRSSVGTLAAWNKTIPHVCSKNIDNSYYASRIIDAHQSVFQSDLSLEPCNPELGKRKQLGPTKQVILDTTGGPRMVRGDLKRCEVALTFDDGPHPMYSRELLEILEKENVHANYFVVGRMVRRHPVIADDIAKAGHIIGNHSYSHKDFHKFPFKETKAEIVNGFRELLKIWDFTTPFFRFPYGAHTKKTRAFNKSRDVAEFFWNMDTRDWGIKDRKALLRNTLKEIDREKRGILLFHDVHPQTIDIMPKVLVALREAGYTTAVFVPEDLIEDEFPN